MVSGVVSPTIRDSRHPDETGKLRGFVFMAPRQASAPAVAANAEVSEREYQTTLNAAVAATEDEIFTDALGGDELDNDGDTSLEDMGDGLEDEAEESDEAEEDDEGESQKAAEGEEGEEAEAAQAAGDDEGEGAAEQPRREPVVTSKRLREESQRARQAEERLVAAERTIAEYNGRLSELSARVNAPPPRQAETPAPKPDMFAEPDKYEAWVLDQAERRANASIQQQFQAFQQQQQQQENQRLDMIFNAAAQGPRGWEFMAAYNALMKLNPRDQNAANTVYRITKAPDPVAAMIEWFDGNGGEDYRAQVYEQLAPRIQERQQGAARHG